MLKAKAKAINLLSKYTIEVGVIAGKSKQRQVVSIGLTNAELMFIHENGSAVNNIPARPVLQMTIEYVKEKWLDKTLNKCINGILEKDWEEPQIEKELGILCERVKNYAQDIIYKNEGKLKPNAPSTVAAKGFDHPLFVTGQLARSITCQFVKKD